MTTCIQVLGTVQSDTVPLKKNPKKQQTTKKATVGIIKDGPGTGDEIHRHG